MRAAIIDSLTNEVVNIIEADPDFSPPDGQIIIWNNDVQMSWTYNGSVLVEPDTPAMSEEEGIALVKEEASRRILSQTPDWKQRNMIARSVELLQKMVSGEPLTAKEEAEKASLEGAWSKIKRVRKHSDDLESAIIQSRSVDAVSGSIDGSGAWPE